MGREDEHDHLYENMHLLLLLDLKLGIADAVNVDAHPFGPRAYSTGNGAGDSL